MVGKDELLANVQEWLTQVIEEYKDDASDDNITRWRIIDADNHGNDLAIVCGWTPGFDNEGTDWYKDGEWRLYMKFAMQPRNSLMQEYDVDWEMPVYGDVDDNEIPISDNEVDVKWLIDSYERYMRECAKEDSCQIIDEDEMWGTWQVVDAITESYYLSEDEVLDIMRTDLSLEVED